MSPVRKLAAVMRELLDAGADEKTVASMATGALIEAIADPSRCGHVGIQLASGSAMRCVLDANHSGVHAWRR